MSQLETTFHNLTSPKRGHTFWGLVLTCVAAAILLWVKHKGWLPHANDFLLSDSPDGFKNYMTAAWHVAHDSSYVHYGGMSYPFGEHVLFTDNQPIFAAAMQWWNRHVGDIGGQVVGLMNQAEVLSQLLGCGVLFLLLRKLHLPVWYAGLVALGMMFLSPQQNRMDAHFGLSHIWVFPLLLFLLCRYEERHSRRYESLWIGALVWFSAQLHFYYFGLAAIFLGFYTFFQWLKAPSWRNTWTRASHLAVMVILPFALLNGWVQWTDFAVDRPSNPYGFTTYIGQWEGVFLPYQNFPLYQWIDNNIVKVRAVNGEAFAYCGMAATAFTIWLLRRRFRLFEAEWDEAAYHRVHKQYLSAVFAAALACLLFACGFPFAIKGLEWMVDYLGPLRQFRGLGRFTWAWFYVVNLTLFYIVWNHRRFAVATPAWFDRWTNRLQDPVTPIRALWNPTQRPLAVVAAPETNVETQLEVAQLPAPFSAMVRAAAKVSRLQVYKAFLVALPLGCLAWEAYYFQKHKTFNLQPNVANKQAAKLAPDHWLNKVDFSKFQALMPVPYYHVGSENIWLDFIGPHYVRTQMTAFHTGVPDMGVNMSRTSLGNTLKSVQMAYHPCEMPVMLEELPDNRPLALMVHGGDWPRWQREYRHLLRNALPVYDHPDMKILSLPPDSLRSYVRWYRDSLHRAMLESPTHPMGRWRSTDPVGPVVSETFDDRTKANKIFQGAGALQGWMDDTLSLCRAKLPKGLYTVSLWLYAKQDMALTQEIRIVENHLSNGQEVHHGHEGLRFYLKSITNDWALFEVPFEVYEQNTDIHVWTYKKDVHVPCSIDEVLIKPAKTTVFREERNWFSCNNFWYKWAK